MLQFFRPAGLVQIALTLPGHKGEMFSPPAPCFRTKLDGFEKTETFAQEQKVYFLILCNKTTASGRSIVSSLCFIYVYLLTLVSMLCLCRHTLSQRCVRLSNGRSLSKATSGLSSSAVTHLEQFTGSRTQCGGWSWTASV